MMRLPVLLLMMIAIAPAWAAPLSLDSQVYQSPGSVSDLAKKGQVCMVQAGGAELISSDPDNGIVVARVVTTGRSMLMQYTAQSTVTFMAKEGRFKFVYNNVGFADGGYNSRAIEFQTVDDRAPIAKSISTRLQAMADKVAACITSGDTGKDNW